MLTTIKVYGRIAKFLGQRKFEAAVDSAAEAVRFLLANFPKLEPELTKGHYRVIVGNYDLEENELTHPSGMQIIRIVPLISGAGGVFGTVGRIIAGVALIALSVITLGAGAPLLGTLGAKIAFGVGTSLVLGGVAQLLTPVPTIAKGVDKQDDPRKSYSFSGIQNVSRQGVPVPIIYGEVITGSVTISVGIDTIQVAA